MHQALPPFLLQRLALLPSCTAEGAERACAAPDGARAKRAKLENGVFTPAGESVQNTVQPEAPEQTVTQALAGTEAA